MTSVQDLLNQIWSFFRQIGIADDIAIIGHIAALLLEKSGIEPPDARLQAVTSAWPHTDQILQRLEEAANKAEGAATLLDRYVFFRLPTMLPGGRYPTPRHIVQSMLRLAEVKPHHRLWKWRLPCPPTKR